MKIPDKKKYKIITKENFYRPSTFSPYTYNRFMKQFTDKNTWGYNNKKHYHSKAYINLCLSSANPKYRAKCHSTFQHQLDLDSRIIPFGKVGAWKPLTHIDSAVFPGETRPVPPWKLTWPNHVGSFANSANPSSVLPSLSSFIPLSK